MTNYMIATILSLISACFTFASSWTKDPDCTYWYQVGQCLVYAAASYFFGVYPSIIMMLINAFRNVLVATGKYKPAFCFLFSVLALVFGLMTNTSGFVGYLSILATVQYSICSYYMRGEIPVKINNFINLAIWLSYDILILDVFTGITDVISIVLTTLTVKRIYTSRQRFTNRS